MLVPRLLFMYAHLTPCTPSALVPPLIPPHRMPLSRLSGRREEPVQAPLNELSRCPPGSYRAVHGLCLPVLVTSVETDTSSFCGPGQVRDGDGGGGRRYRWNGAVKENRWWLLVGPIATS